MSTMEKSIDYVIENEGTEYTDDENDSGGPTRYGITQEDLSRYLGRSASPQEVRNMDRQTAELVYLRFYWGPMHLDFLSDQKIATAVFDIGVNRGIVRGIKYAQQSYNSLAHQTASSASLLVVDGHIGPKTILALNGVSRKSFIQNYCKLVVAGYVAIIDNNPTQEEFRDGWMNRAKRLLTLI